MTALPIARKILRHIWKSKASVKQTHLPPVTEVLNIVREVLLTSSIHSLESELLNFLSPTAQASNKKVINIFQMISSTHMLSYLLMVSFLGKNSLQKITQECIGIGKQSERLLDCSLESN